MIKDKIKPLLKNFYFLFFLSFILWMTLIDSNGFINRYRLSSKMKELKNQRNFYLNEIEKISFDKDRFDNDDELLEKFAREEYLMKKETEDIYYIIKE